MAELCCQSKGASRPTYDPGSARRCKPVGRWSQVGHKVIMSSIPNVSLDWFHFSRQGKGATAPCGPGPVTAWALSTRPPLTLLLACLGQRSPREPLLAEDLPALVRNECLHAQCSRGTAASAFCLLRMTPRLMWARVWLGHPRARTVHPGSGAATRLCQHLWDEPGDPPRRVTAACCPPSERGRPLGFALRPLFQDRSDLGTGRAR